ncbi:MAG: hypothetical protein CM15mP9_0650 [Methanobacteriota archaeon]|nr:MAG: hypothetical protein CM15mP9_0650 [Euryarchaeota archaeon]
MTANVLPDQTMTGTCDVEAAIPSDYSFIIYDPAGQEITRYRGNTHSNDDDCEIYIQNMEKGNLYQVVIISENVVQEATFKLTMDYYDGIPENMNNKSQWIGPEVESWWSITKANNFLEFLWFWFLHNVLACFILLG